VNNSRRLCFSLAFVNTIERVVASLLAGHERLSVEGRRSTTQQQSTTRHGLFATPQRLDGEPFRPALGYQSALEGLP